MQRTYFDQFLLGKEGSKWFIKKLINSYDDLESSRLSVIKNEDFKNLSKVLIIKAEYDHLNDEIGDYYSILREKGVDVALVNNTGTFHGFVTMYNWTSQLDTHFWRLKIS